MYITKRLTLSLMMLVLQVMVTLAEPYDVHYRVGTERLKNHRLDIVATFPPSAFSGEDRVLALPVWTPGSYKVRDYSRFLSDVRPLNPGVELEKTSKNRWLVKGLDPTESLRVAYSVYGHELTVRTNYFTPELSLVVGAATFLAPAPLQSDRMVKLPYIVEFDQPAHTGLPAIGENTFRASDYDQLVDSPFVLGDATAHDFVAGGEPHQLVQAGDTRFWDLDTSLEDTARLVDTILEFWGGSAPYDRYVFLNLVTDGRGGLEHQNSTVVMTSRFATQDRDAYLGWLSLLSHEFFHTWNIKRLRPANLGPFDYENEVYTPSLWIAEGITSYYDDLLVRRAGLSTREEYLEALSRQLNNLYNTPGRHALTLADSSFDAWIRLYQPTDDLHNSHISYYNKGAVVGWLLDAEIRRRSGGKKSLDDLMRQAYATFGPRGFHEHEFRELASEVAGSDLSAFFARAVDSQDELDLKPALDYWGLSWEPESETVEPYLGVEVGGGSRPTVTKVFADSPAARAGIAPGDELLAIDDVRLPARSPLKLLENLETDGRVYSVLLARLGRIWTKSVELGEPPHRESQLEFEEASSQILRRRLSWLGPESETER